VKLLKKKVSQIQGIGRLTLFLAHFAPQTSGENPVPKYLSNYLLPCPRRGSVQGQEKARGGEAKQALTQEADPSENDR
jgi:hypothetical protein